jgi:hypothetical protein
LNCYKVVRTFICLAYITRNLCILPILDFLFFDENNRITQKQLIYHMILKEIVSLLCLVFFLKKASAPLSLLAELVLLPRVEPGRPRIQDRCFTDICIIVRYTM